MISVDFEMVTHTDVLLIQKWEDENNIVTGIMEELWQILTLLAFAIFSIIITPFKFTK